LRCETGRRSIVPERLPPEDHDEALCQAGAVVRWAEAILGTGIPPQVANGDPATERSEAAGGSTRLA